MRYPVKTAIKKFAFHSCVALVTSGMLFGSIESGQANEAVSQRNKLKSAIIVNFIRYTRWPQDSLYSQSADINVCVYANHEMEESLLNSKGKTINNKIIEIRILYRLRGLDECHVLYTENMDRTQVKRVFSIVNNKPILTITDQTNGSENSGIINFIDEAERLRFEIFIEKSTAANLKISSRLLNLSTNNSGR